MVFDSLNLITSYFLFPFGIVFSKLNCLIPRHNFPPLLIIYLFKADLIKIDVQGAEVDIIKGGLNTINNAKRLIVELQHTEYNQGALKVDQSLPIIEGLGWKCTDPLFQNNGVDGDYGFVRIEG